MENSTTFQLQRFAFTLAMLQGFLLLAAREAQTVTEAIFGTALGSHKLMTGAFVLLMGVLCVIVALMQVRNWIHSIEQRRMTTDSKRAFWQSGPLTLAAQSCVIIYLFAVWTFADLLGWSAQQIAIVGLALLVMPMIFEDLMIRWHEPAAAE